MILGKGIEKIADKKTIYTKGKSIDGQTHYGENVLLTYSLLSKQVLLRHANYIIVHE
ncbi:hypothetical protein HMPREF9418_1367 [Neisseria macacae ATCC 33926]|uniref:Uncharacterized protein n=1 Tax=Neisseria macacae ATCC 33926 TaxID=997348 RepID=A0AA36UKG5_9NEIS|nr:hypothetical protein HMPREF9418_1367 [Neisseria macacae ATCC 33926]